jgi:hypothetical protein
VEEVISSAFTVTGQGEFRHLKQELVPLMLHALFVVVVVGLLALLVEVRGDAVSVTAAVKFQIEINPLLK